jgi:hypothetical protein
MNYNDFFEHLASNNSSLFKLAELEKRKGDTLLQRIIFLALDPFTQFYIRKIPEYTPRTWAELSHEYSLETNLDRLSKLSTREITGNEAIKYLKDILMTVSQDDAKVIERIISKDLKCGVSSKVNKIWPGLIAEFPVMLCSQFDQKLVDKIRFPAAVQIKHDGMRFAAIVRQSTVEYRSRNGKQLHLLGTLDHDFINLAQQLKMTNVVFDGELLVVKNDDVLDRQTGNGILNSANKGTITLEEANLVHAVIWDIIPYQHFVAGKFECKYRDRWSLLNTLKLSNKIQLVKHDVVHNMEDVNDLFNQYLDDGEEGIILKSFDGIWEDKRSKSQIKFKNESTVELRVKGIQEGNGKYQGMVGSLECESEDGLLKVSVGSGLNDDLRKSINKSIVDTIIEIKYNTKIKDKKGNVSLFLPVFIRQRLDKNIADLEKDIK